MNPMVSFKSHDILLLELNQAVTGHYSNDVTEDEVGMKRNIL